MAKKLILLGAVVTALAFASCATYSTVDGVRTPLGLLTPSGVNSGRATPIASYSVIFGLFTSGYGDFLNKTKGQDVDIIDTDYLGIYRSVKAVPRNK